MQSEILQAFICHNFDDYGFAYETPKFKIRILWKGFHISKP